MARRIVLKLLLLCMVSVLECGIIVHNETSMKKDLFGRNLHNSPNELEFPKLMKNCSLEPVYHLETDIIRKWVEDGIKLIKIKVNLEDEESMENILPDSLYQPNIWMLSTDFSGKALLLLREYFVPMSLGTLSYGVEETRLSLSQIPKDCLKGQETDAVENSFRTAFLKNFKKEETLQFPVTTEICNSYIRASGGTGEVVYNCSSLSTEGYLKKPEILERSFWFTILTVSLYLLQAAVSLFSPFFLKSSAFTSKMLYEEYSYEPLPKLKIRVKIVQNEEQINGSFEKSKLQTFTKLEKFKEALIKKGCNGCYDFTISKIELKIKRTRLVGMGASPVKLFKFLVNFFVKNRISRTLPIIGECLNSRLVPGKDCFKKKWSACFSLITKCFLALVLGALLVGRLVFYWVKEKKYVEYERKVLRQRNLSLSYTGDLVSYWTPTHWLFISIFVVLIFDGIIYFSSRFSKVFQRNVFFIIRKSLRNMHKTDLQKLCQVVFVLMVWPLQKCGVAGCLLMPVWMLTWPLLLIIFSLASLPLLNLLLRLIKNFFHSILKFVDKDISAWWKRVESIMPRIVKVNLLKEKNNDMQNNSKESKPLQPNRTHINTTDDEATGLPYDKTQIIYCFGLLVAFVSVLAFAIIIVECINFYLRCAWYTMIGLILNPSETLKFASLAVLIGFYGYDCFSSVGTKYTTFNNAVNKYIQKKIKSNLEKVAKSRSEEQENVAFSHTDNEDRMSFDLSSGKRLKIRLANVVMFLDKNDMTYIPRPFLFQFGERKETCCPGPIHLLYLTAFRDFMVILLFLFFVFVVVFAFGHATDISSAGRLIAALGSGLLPLLFRKFLFKSHGDINVDEDNLVWKFLLENELNMFSKKWNFKDIHLAMQTDNETDKKTDNETVDEIAAEDKPQLLKSESVMQPHLIAVWNEKDRTYTYFVPRKRDTKELAL